MALHFDRAEYDLRLSRARDSMRAAGIDALLMFRQESLYYLTGYDSFGYVFFQSLVLTADGRLVLLTRAPDLRQARHTSIIDDIRIWVDREDADPAVDLRQILAELGLAGGRLGVEYDAYGLTAANGRRLDAALASFAELTDASRLVTHLRLVKSDAEIAFVRRAAELADLALDAAHDTIRPSAFEGDVLAAMHGAIYRAGGDDPANEFIIGSGQDALLCRYFSGRRHIGAVDQITLEFAGVWRHYHACLMRTIPVGGVTAAQRRMHDVALEAMDACLDALRPGSPIGCVFDAYARVAAKASLDGCRLNACGYSLGTTFAPNWMDWPMFYTGNPVIAEAGMVFFLHMIFMDSNNGVAMCPGQTVLVTDRSRAEVLSRRSLELVSR